MQGKINRGSHTDHPAGRHSIRTNQCPNPPWPHIFYRPDALPAAQPTASKHCRQLITPLNTLIIIIIMTASGQSNLIYEHIVAADGRFNRIRQVMSMCPPMWAHWRHLANTTELVLPLVHSRPQPKRQIDRFSRFLHSSR